MLILRFSLQGPVASLQWTCIKRTSSSSATDWMLANGTVKFASKLLGFVYVAYMMYPALMLLEQAGLETCCRYLLKCKDVVLKGQWEPSLQYAAYSHSTWLRVLSMCVCHARPLQSAI